MPYYPPRPDEGKSGSPKENRTIRWIVLGVSLLLIVFGTVRLVSYGLDLISSRRTTQELREIASVTDSPVPEAFDPIPETDASGEIIAGYVFPESTAALLPAPEAAESAVPAARPSQSSEKPVAAREMLPSREYPNGYNVVPKIQTLRKKNENIIGWITMDDLDEPVVKKDNDFFLDHDASGKKNVAGAIFMDENTNLLTRPYTILLYGHNMKTGDKFGNLRKYEDPSYCFRHRIFHFDTLFEEGQYVIFSVVTVSLLPGTSKYVNLVDLQSNDILSRESVLRALKDRSLVNMTPTVSAEDQLLLLITCVGDDNERLIVAARRIRDNENPDNPLLSSSAGI